MRIQLLSDLHLETEVYDPEPAPRAELLVLAGDIDSTWKGLERFRHWPQPVVFVAGNHEFDGRDVDAAAAALRQRCADCAITWLERESQVRIDDRGRRIRLVGTTRWSDFDVFGAERRPRAMRAADYFMRLMGATRSGRPYGPAEVREDALACRAWLAQELARVGDWDATVVITHFAPSLRSADPRYGAQNGTASFCNDDEDLLPHADLWLHGHLHCVQDYRVDHAGGSTRVVCNARGHGHNGEPAAHDPQQVLEV